MNAPNNCEMIIDSLSEYIDGLLAPEKQANITQHIDHCPNCHDMWVRMKTIQAELSSTPLLSDTAPTAEEEALWGAISSQLEVDRSTAYTCGQTSNTAYSEDFISAYFDGEVSYDDPLCRSFESHLPNCDSCNEVLAKLSESSEALKHYGYRIENSTDLDLSKSVMDQIAQESESVPLISQDSTISTETLSAFYDQELSAKEAKGIETQLEQNHPAKEQLAAFHYISDKITELQTELEAQAPDLWPNIEVHFTKVLPFPEKSRKALNQRIAYGSIAAAVALILLVGPIITKQISQPTISENYTGQEIANVPPQEIAMMQDATTLSASNTKTFEKGLQPVALPEQTPSAEEYLMRHFDRQIHEDSTTFMMSEEFPQT